MSAIALEKSTEAYVLRDADLEIAYRLIGDRWQHQLAVRDNAAWTGLLISEEGLPDDGVPPSPALQDLRFEEIDEGVFEFQLLGQAGKGVYSAAVRFDSVAGQIDFDYCSRSRSTDIPVCTLSRYRSVGDDQLAAVHKLPASLLIRSWKGAGLEVSPLSQSHQYVCECRSVGTSLAPRIAVGCFGASQTGPKGKSVSIRWQYRVMLVGS